MSDVMGGIALVWAMGIGIALPFALMNDEVDWDIRQRLAFGIAWPIVFLAWILRGIVDLV